MSEETDFVIVGRVGRVHGIHGFIKIHSFTEPKENILNYKDWYFFIDYTWQKLDIARLEVHDRQILAQIRGFEGREEAQKLTNIDIGIKKALLPELDSGEFYWHQLLGLKVLNAQGEVLGTITDILPTGANDVLVVNDERQAKPQNKNQVLIPYLPGKTITDINLQEKKIVVDWDWDF